MATAVLIDGLRKRYGTVEAVRGVSFQVQSGELFGILGPNGAGKTTTLRCLCTLARPDEGRLEIEGISVVANPRAARQRLGYVAQEVALDKVLTGRELLQLQGSLYHLSAERSRQRIEAMIDLLGLQTWADQLSGTYSGGIRKRFDLAAGLLHEPKVLVLDEPTVGLDIESRTVIWQLLREIRQQGITIMMTSHYLEEIDALADRVAIIDHGQVIALGTPSALKDQVGGERITLRVREFTPTDEAETVRHLLQALEVVEQVILNPLQGNSLNLVVKPHSNALGLIQTCLEQHNLPLFSITQARPSLDDVYLAATGQTLLDAELAGAAQRDLKAEKKQAMRGA
jgi:ABC-2 type transport system ATP-binding protein